MGACAGCSQLILVIINLLFSLIGLALLVIASLVKAGSTVFDSLLQDAYNKFVTAVKEAAADQDFSLGDLDVGKLVGDAAIAFIVIGGFFFLLGVFGCLGAVCKAKVLLTIYIIVVCLVFLVELVFVILLFSIRSKIDGWIKDPLIDTLKEKYTGTNGTDLFTTTINFVMHEMECCGIDSYKDFSEATHWRYNTSKVIPYICCKNKSLHSEECVENPTTNNSYIDEGCYEAVNDWLKEQQHILIAVGSSVAAVQLLLIIFSFVICCQSRRNDDDKDSYDEQFPIQPYREPPELQGHKNMSYEQTPYHSRHDVRDKYYREDPRDARGHSPQGYNDHVTYYQGRKDRYDSPPREYRR